MNIINIINYNLNFISADLDNINNLNNNLISIRLTPGIFAYSIFMALLFGAAMGSFLNCAAWRIANGESFLHGRSHCPACGHMLNALDLIPVFGWIILKGRCRYCGERVSIRYPLTELFFAFVTAACLFQRDFSILCLRDYIFLCCLFCLSLVDMEKYIIPDGCLIISVITWFLALPWVKDNLNYKIWIYILTGVCLFMIMLILSLVMDFILKKESLGGGDIKLFGVVGLYLGPAGSMFAVFIACILGLCVAGLSRKGRGQPFPFGPAIAAGAAYMLLWGDWLSNWYLSLLGL